MPIATARRPSSSSTNRRRSDSFPARTRSARSWASTTRPHDRRRRRRHLPDQPRERSRARRPTCPSRSGRTLGSDLIIRTTGDPYAVLPAVQGGRARRAARRAAAQRADDGRGDRAADRAAPVQHAAAGPLRRARAGHLRRRHLRRDGLRRRAARRARSACAWRSARRAARSWA